ncbi:C-terminal binding protein [Spirochaeta isovalerica]|uniref:D-3-phosphoglycerate dehydrogenase n=1 Tax=Spirochaeta isovalerica TaxID=150 RepID=A0A841REU4_9SPIO|nr:C-terminal binding protein [Spirochaeta isovalerica]MBB6481128.1 D-3-phosphoglycerate dehydrogenase [Spirochaeta isovalerica]
MNKYKVVVTDNLNGNCHIEKKILQSINAEVHIYKELHGEELCLAVEDADAVLVDMAEITAEVINRMKKCRVISRYGVGYDNVDVKAAFEAGIKVAIVPDYCVHEVAEHAFALLLSFERQIAQRAAAVRSGRWRDVQTPGIRRIQGSVLGIIGYGKTGLALKRMAEGFGFSRILVHSRGLEPGLEIDQSVYSVTMEELLVQSDYISIHLPLTEETRSFIDEESFKKMKNNAVLINTARGAIVDEPALKDAILKGEIRGAALDVLSHEPPGSEINLAELDKVIITDHRAYYSEDSIALLKEKCAQNVVSALKTGSPIYEVNYR